MKKINNTNWKEVFYGDYVDHIEVNETNPLKRKDARYVSVEHIETGKLKIKDITDTDGSMFLITSTQKGNRVIQTGGNAQLEYIKKLQSNDGNKFNIHTGKLNRTIIP